MKPERLIWTPELVKRFWDGFSHTRLVEYSFAKQAGRSVLISIGHMLPCAGEILDFGAGDGYLVRLLCERGWKATAYEPSTGRADNLRANLENFESFTGIVDDGSTRTFEAVLMCETIEHILDEEIDRVLTRLRDFVAPGGVLIVTTPNNEDLDLGMVYCPVSNMLYHRWQHVRSFDRDSLKELLAHFGFCEVVTHEVSFDDNVFVPTDKLWGGATSETVVPDYIEKIRCNEPTKMGAQSNLLYIGRKRA